MDEFWARFNAFLDALSPFSRICVLVLIIFSLAAIMSPYFALNSLRGIYDELKQIRKELRSGGDNDA